MRRGGFGGGSGNRSQGGPGFGGPGRGAPGGFSVERLMRFDENSDGKVAKNELPEFMQRILDRADANNDGAIDRAEAEKMAERFQRARSGGRPPGGDRNSRPQRDQR